MHVYIKGQSALSAIMLQSLQIWLLLAGLHMFSLAVHLLITPSLHWFTTNLV